MNLVILFLALGLVQTFAELAQDASKCGQYPDCAECIKHNLCGWCAVPVQYDDGSRGPHCAGKPQDPSNPPPGYKPWFCPQDFQNDKCFGYICDTKTFQCVSSHTPGGGQPLSDCLELCFPPTYDCNTTTGQCFQTVPGKGTDLMNCERQCHVSSTTGSTTTASTTGEPGPEGPPSPEQLNQYNCNLTSLTCERCNRGGEGCMPKADCDQVCGKPNNNTPVFTIGDYRGVQINSGYVSGEWQARITATDITIADPTGRIFVKGAVRTYNNELWIVRTDGGVHRGIYGINEVPELSILTWGLSQVGESVPANFDAAAVKGLLFVWAKCLRPENCNFRIFQSLAKIMKQNNMIYSLPEITEKRTIEQAGVNDPCSKYPDCHSCISAPEFCGWCSVPILYNSTIPGKNCAGLNTTITPKINCTGTFSTQDCSHATTDASTAGSTGGTTAGADNYLCDPVLVTCRQSQNGTQPKATCDAQCQPGPMPPQLQGKLFRGLEVDMTYLPGEWRAKFGIDEVTIVTPTGSILHGKVRTVGIFLSILFDDGSVVASLWQTQPGPATLFLNWAWGAPNAEAPRSFDEAMTNRQQKEFFLVACLDGKSTTVCNFQN